MMLILCMTREPITLHPDPELIFFVDNDYYHTHHSCLFTHHATIKHTTCNQIHQKTMVEHLIPIIQKSLLYDNVFDRFLICFIVNFPNFLSLAHVASNLEYSGVI